jgi:threonine aldolase
MDSIIDLRSDTITQPTPAMRRAMAKAEIGDDLHGEDPTTHRLEEMSAEILGKEAALFVASGTMADLIAFLVLCKPGSEIIMEENSYTYWSEAGGWARFGGLASRRLKGVMGVPSLKDIENAIRPHDLFEPPTGAICVENPHNWAGGVIIPIETVQSIADVGHRHGVPLYVDGARLFNAAVAMGKRASSLAAPADAVMFCLSKGLCCPVGAILAGSKAFVEKARFTRQALGGGMAMPGILAAAGIVALETMVDRLAEDNANARLLAEGIAALKSGLIVDLRMVQTNMVFVDVSRLKPGRQWFLSELEARGVKAWGILDRWVRFVTHYGIAPRDIEHAVRIVAEVTRGTG